MARAAQPFAGQKERRCADHIELDVGQSVPLRPEASSERSVEDKRIAREKSCSTTRREKPAAAEDVI